MQRKEYIWIFVLITVAALYIHFFTNWFSKGQIVVTPSLRPAFGGDGSVYSVVFSLNGQYQLKNLKVVPLEDGKIDPKGHALWRLVSDSNSAPTQVFVYGQHIRGMKSSPADTKADPLEPDVVYRLLVSANGVSGYTDFKTRAAQPN